MFMKQNLQRLVLTLDNETQGEGGREEFVIYSSQSLDLVLHI